MTTTKQYLGAGVYADIEGGRIKLTAENGWGVSSTIYLEPEMVAELVRYATNQTELILEQKLPPEIKKSAPSAIMRMKRRLRRL